MHALQEEYVFPETYVDYEEAYARLINLVQNCECVLRGSVSPDAAVLWAAVKDVR